MSVRIPPFAALRAFEAVGRLGGIRSAARALQLSHAIVSRHVSSLERDLGVALLDRENGKLTDAGTAYHRALASAFRQLESATNEIGGHSRDNLVITCAPGLASNWLAAKLAFDAEKLNLKGLILKSEPDLPNLSDNTVDGDIRYISDRGKLPKVRAVRSALLVRPQFFPVASPSLVGDGPVHIESAANLISMPLIAETEESEWRIWTEAQGVELDRNIEMSRYGDAQLVLAAARAGHGIALANRYLIGGDLASGQLVRIKAASGDFREVRLGAYYFRAHNSRWTDRDLARFHRWLAEGLGGTVKKAPST